MRIIRFVNPQNQVHAGVRQSDNTARIVTGIEQGAPALTDQIQTITQLLPPVAPSNIFCIGKNYAAHAKESGGFTGDGNLPDTPIIFMKPTSALIPDGQPIRIPHACEHGPEVDYEAELAVVIGPRAVRDVTSEHALQAVFGYTVAHDVSARRWQKHNGGQWIRAKSFDTFCPMGPELVTADEVPDPQNLAVRCTLNGAVMQDGHTRDMIFPVAELIAFLSRDTTLLPWTVILTGTPDGVGFARNPPVFLKPGDTVSVEVEGIGKLTNPVQ